MKARLRARAARHGVTRESVQFAAAVALATWPLAALYAIAAIGGVR